MRDELYLLLRKASIPEFNKECISLIEKETQLDYRTVRGLVRIINNEPNIKSSYLDVLTDIDYYTLNNCIYLAASGLVELIPTKFFCDSEFLKETKIDYLPSNFVAGNDNITSFTIAPEIKHIGYGAFANCKNLIDVFFGDNVQDIGDECFKNDVSLRSVALPEKLRKIGKGAFEGSGLYEFTIPCNIDRLEEETFKDCKELCVVDSCSKNVIDIDKKCFCGCSELIDINFIVGKCDNKAFYKCINLKKISLSGPMIGKKAFAFCESLIGIYFKDETPVKIKKDAFEGCIDFKEVLSDGYAYELRESDGYYEITNPLKVKIARAGNTTDFFTYYSKLGTSFKIVFG